MKRLTLVLEEFNASGGLRVLSAVTNVAAGANIDVAIVCPDYAAKPFFSLDPKVKLVIISTGRCMRRIRYLSAVCRMRWIYDGMFMTGNFRLISLITAVGRIAGREMPLFVIQGMDRVSLIELTEASLIAKQINRILFAISQRVPCHRVYVSRFLKVAYGQPGAFIPNFVSNQFVQRSVSEISSVIRIGCVCTSAPNKGFSLFLDAFARMNSDGCIGRNVEFFCATQDTILIKKYSNSGVIFVKPNSDEAMYGFYRSCHIFTSLSVSEGFGLPALEAMASGCAIVCTDSGGVSDFLLDGYNGILLSERSGTAVAAALKQLVLNKALRLELATAGQAYSKYYTYERFASGYLKLFQELGVSA